MFCAHCGNRLREDAKFCNKCGASTEGTPDQIQQHSSSTEQSANAGETVGSDSSRPPGSPGLASDAGQPLFPPPPVLQARSAQPESLSPPPPVAPVYPGPSADTSENPLIRESHPHEIQPSDAVVKQGQPSIPSDAIGANSIPPEYGHDSAWRLLDPVKGEASVPPFEESLNEQKPGSMPRNIVTQVEQPYTEVPEDEAPTLILTPQQLETMHSANESGNAEATTPAALLEGAHAPLAQPLPALQAGSGAVEQPPEVTPLMPFVLSATVTPSDTKPRERMTMAPEPAKDHTQEPVSPGNEPAQQEISPSTPGAPLTHSEGSLDAHSASAAPAPEVLSAVPSEGSQEGPGEEEYTPLEIGHVLQGRYKIESITQSSPPLNVYTISDQRAYEKCWNCGSTEGHQSDKFCPDCGASLYGYSFILTEMPAGATQPVTPAADMVALFEENGRDYLVSQAPKPEENYFPFGVTLLVGAKSEAGRERAGDPNEDSILTVHFSRIHESKVVPFGIFVVADGMGGHDNGQVASKQAISVMAQNLLQDGLLKLLQDGSFKEEYLTELLRTTILKTNESLVQENQKKNTDMGTTMTAAVIYGNIAHIANVGDSRTYLLDEQQYRPITNDHSLVASLVAAGMIGREDVYTHPQRNQIYRSLGDKPELQVDTFIQQLTPDATLVLCSDGMWEMVHDPEMERILRAAPHPQAAAEELVKAANANGGEDNISVIVVKAIATASA